MFQTLLRMRKNMNDIPAPGKIEDLKAAYDEQKKEYAENHGFYNCTVPTSWGEKIQF